MDETPSFIKSAVWTQVSICQHIMRNTFFGTFM